jgi:hypothetical protein
MALGEEKGSEKKRGQVRFSFDTSLGPGSVGAATGT